WVVSNATSLTLDNGIGSVTGTSSITVSPSATTVYTLTATNSSGSATAQTSVTVIPDGIPPSTPTHLQASNVTSSSVTLKWTKSTDNIAVAGYQIFRNGVQIGTTTGTSYSDTGLSPSTTYAYTVAAFDASGNVSPQSWQLAVTTKRQRGSFQ